MFTGIVEAVGRVERIETRGEIRELEIRAPELVEGLRLGESVSVDGACLTVTDTGASSFTVEVIGTTLARTIAGGYRAGAPVNLERALVMGQRLDGHMVQGHVDGLGFLRSVSEVNGFWLLDFQVPEDVWAQTILHGSIAINGISLTVNRLDPPDGCQVGIIPHTWEHTNLRHLKPGDPVNLEGDLIGKYVGRMLAARRGGPRPAPGA